LVTSFAEYLRQYGGYLSVHTHGDFRFLPYSVEQFFINGGTRCYISRVIPEDAASATGKAGVLTFTAANEGKWGNRITVSFVASSRRKMQLRAAGEGENTYAAKSVVGFKEGDIVTFDGEVNRIATILDNAVTFENAFGADPVDDALVPKKLIYSSEMDVIVRSDDAAEVYNGVDLNPSSPDYIERRFVRSEIVQVSIDAANEIAPPVSVVFGEGETKGTIPLGGGKDGTIESVDAGVFIGVDKGPGKRTGIEAFKENNIVSLIAVPGVTIPEVVVSLVTHCENEKNRFAVIDAPINMVKTGDLVEYRGIVDSSFAAFYHPWVQVYDRLAQKSSFVPPSGSVLGVFSRTDIERGVHKAPANEPVSCTGLSTN
jgi:hypothetical protein